MEMYHAVSHATWECKYHVVFISKYRKKGLYDQLRKKLGPVLKTWATQKECQIEEGHLLPDQVHMLIDIPPKYSVAQVAGYIKGKSAIYIARTFLGHKLYYGGQHFCARGYLHCRTCEAKVSITSGTIFKKARFVLKTWFLAIWFVTSQKHGYSVLGLKRVLGLGSYQTAWTWLHKMRRAMVRLGRERLHWQIKVN